VERQPTLEKIFLALVDSDTRPTTDNGTIDTTDPRARRGTSDQQEQALR